MIISLVISIVSLSLCVSGFFFLRWYISQRTNASRLLEEYREEVYRLISEIDAATDRDSRLVEERIKTLRNLLDDTDKRILYIRANLSAAVTAKRYIKNLAMEFVKRWIQSPLIKSPRILRMRRLFRRRCR